MSDPTQFPPFGTAVRVDAGVVTAFLGNANAHWCEYNGAVFVPSGVAVDIGWTYNGTDFLPPLDATPLPADTP